MPVMFCLETSMARASPASVSGSSAPAMAMRIAHCCGVTFAFSNTGARWRISRLASWITPVTRSRSGVGIRQYIDDVPVLCQMR